MQLVPVAMHESQSTDYVERARQLGPELEAAAEEIERCRELPEPIVEALVECGLFRLLLPRSLGGAEIAARDLGISQANAVTLQNIAARQAGFVVPEPATLPTLALGLGVLVMSRRKLLAR